MANVFLSYRRNAAADEALARQAHATLTADGHTVFLDQFMQFGESWVRQISRAVKEADFMIVFLSADSVTSEMLRGEIEIARKQSGSSGHGPVILPVRVAYSGPLPYPLNAYLDRLQPSVWTGERDTPKLMVDLARRVAQPAAPFSEQGEPRGRAASPAGPEPWAPLPVPGGALDVDDPHYVVRQADHQILPLARKPGQTVVITGPRQMGKSSLLIRYLIGALEHGQRVAMLDFQLLDEQSRRGSDEFFHAFTHGILDALGLDAEAALSLWSPHSSGPQNCTRVIEKVVLSGSSAPTVVALDEVDVLFGRPFGQDFFGMVRSWHNLRANPTKAGWKAASVVLVTSTEPFLFIDRLYESPFNVGITSRLTDFTREQLEQLNASHGGLLAYADLDALYRLLSGHPYLTRRALYTLATHAGMRVADLIDQAASDRGPFSDHLRYFLLRLARIPDAAAEFRNVLHRQPTHDPRLLERLSAAGLITMDGDIPRPRCELYETYYKSRL